jgi:DNA-binding transcriptional MerR regulator
MTKALLKRLEEGKLYYSISEVCQITGLEQHVLRYWENEFPQLKPKKNRAGNRAYRAKEIKLIRYIKYLLYDELYTIQGAKRKIADASAPELEGQVNLLGPLPGIGAALPSQTASLPRRKKAKEAAETLQPVATTVSIAETALETLDVPVLELPRQEATVNRELLLNLKREMNEILRLLGKDAL